MEIGLFYNNGNNRSGPGKLAGNLTKGLSLAGANVSHNRVCEYTGCLQPTSFDVIPESALIGPNIMVLPNEYPMLWKRFKNHVVPCGWVKNKYESFSETAGLDLNIWSVGIDTDVFSVDKKPEIDYLIYYKNRDIEIMRDIKRKLDPMGLTYTAIAYGNYNEEQFLKLLAKCKGCIVASGTESQGIAYMEMLSTNTPCYVLDKTTWDDNPNYSFQATSAPYFTDECGIKCSDLSMFEEFNKEVNNYNPRDYILREHTLLRSAENYISLLESTK
jgi:hypothetical protein